MEARGLRAAISTLQLEQLIEGQSSPSSPRWAKGLQSPRGAPTSQPPLGLQSCSPSRSSVQDFRELAGARVPMLLAVSVLLYEWVTYNTIFLWRVLPMVGKSRFAIPFLLVFNAFWGLAVWSYIRAHAADPGSVPKRWQEFVISVGDALPIAPARSEWQPGKATYCQKCRVPRPERAHHCIVCGMCVLRMDHHCPWINNCVGFHNHKFFLLVGIYCCITSIIALVTTFPEIVVSVAVLLHMDSFLTDEAKQILTADVVVLLVFGFLALVFFTLLTPMVASHLPLAKRNQTTIENHYDNMPNPFDQGNAFANFAQVFGAFGPDWFLPVTPRRPLSDGVSFARSDESIGADGMPELRESLAADEDEPEVERLWRLRYNVRATEPIGEKPPDPGPLRSFARWWSWPPAPPPRRIVSL